MKESLPSPTLGADGKLTFRVGSPGARYYLGEQGVHAGEHASMRLDDGAWTHVRFEWNPHWQEPPVLIAEEETAFGLEEGMRFRWQKPR